MLFVSDGSTLEEKIEDYDNYVGKLIKSGLRYDHFSVQILENIDNLMDIIETNEPADKKDQKYFSKDPLYNSLANSRKIPATYLCTCRSSDITNYLRSGIADIYLNDRGGLGDDDFHYYTYLTDKTRSPSLTKENYELIYAYYKLIQSKCLKIRNNSQDAFYEGYSFYMGALYNISKSKALEIGYDLLQEASIKHKFSLSSLKSVSAIDIIKFCIDEKYLLDHNVIKQSIKRMKYKKNMILDKVKKEFDGTGSIWKFICSSDTLYLDELRFIADINGIKNTGMLSKQDLCSELEKLSTGNKNTVLASCQNESDISGDDVKDIPAEYFFAYQENGKPYCTDIRSAYANIKAGNNKNPYTNVEIPKETRDKIVELYESSIIPERESKPTFSQLLANFSSKIPYLNSVELYKNATKEQVEKFFDKLLTYPTFEQIIMESWNEGTLEEDKYTLIDNILLNKNFDDFKYQLREDYNRIFSGIATPVRPTIT